jgi:hypothetical protein
MRYCAHSRHDTPLHREGLNEGLKVLGDNYILNLLLDSIKKHLKELEYDATKPAKLKRVSISKSIVLPSSTIAITDIINNKFTVTSVPLSSKKPKIKTKPLQIIHDLMKTDSNHSDRVKKSIVWQIDGSVKKYKFRPNQLREWNKSGIYPIISKCEGENSHSWSGHFICYDFEKLCTFFKEPLHQQRFGKVITAAEVVGPTNEQGLVPLELPKKEKSVKAKPAPHSKGCSHLRLEFERSTVRGETKDKYKDKTEYYLHVMKRKTNY